MAISQEQAERVVRAAVKKSLEIGVNMNIAVVDNGAHLKSFVRMDGAFIGSIDIAFKKSQNR